MILVYSPSLRRDVDLTRATTSDLDALRKDMDLPGAPAPGIRRVIEAALTAGVR